MSPPVEGRRPKMASMTMAEAVLEHAHQFYDVDNWYVVAECWDVWSVLEALDLQEEKTHAPFTLETGAIAFFAQMMKERRTVH
jgi:hypothetical protein